MTGPHTEPGDGATQAMISAVVVCYLEDRDLIRTAIESLDLQDRRPDEIVVVDNSPDARHRDAAERAGAIYIQSGRNLGFPQAVNLAAGRSHGDHIFLLNPDATAEADCLRILEGALEADREAAVAGAQVLLPDGRVNAGDNPIHPSGLSWSGNYLGRPATGEPRPTLAVSGAAILIRTGQFRSLDGFHPAFFMYYDDTDFCWRARIAGRRVLFCPQARVRHDYSFDQGAKKWGWLEASRLAAVLTNYESRTLLLLAPMLFAVELATLAVAARDGWIREKIGAWRAVWRYRQEIRLRRQTVKRSRRLGDRALLTEFAPAVDTPLLDSGLLRATRLPQELYVRIVLLLLGRSRCRQRPDHD